MYEFFTLDLPDMNRIINCIILLAGFGLLFSGCLPPKKIGTSGDDTYNEDLSSLRSSYADSLVQAMEKDKPTNTTANPETPRLSATIDASYSMNGQLDDFLNEVALRNKEENTYQGYTVQVYTGSSREKANNAKNRVYNVLPEASPKVSFDPPNYRVKVGEFSDRLEAQPVYAKLKRSFPVVLIVPEKFPITTKD